MKRHIVGIYSGLVPQPKGEVTKIWEVPDNCAAWNISVKFFSCSNLTPIRFRTKQKLLKKLKAIIFRWKPPTIRISHTSTYGEKVEPVWIHSWYVQCTKKLGGVAIQSRFPTIENALQFQIPKSDNMYSALVTIMVTWVEIDDYKQSCQQINSTDWRSL